MHGKTLKPQKACKTELVNSVNFDAHYLGEGVVPEMTQGKCDLMLIMM